MPKASGRLSLASRKRIGGDGDWRGRAKASLCGPGATGSTSLSDLCPAARSISLLASRACPLRSKHWSRRIEERAGGLAFLTSSFTFKNKLSEYIRLAAGGETVLVTDRDRVVAEIGPPGPARSPMLSDALLLDAFRQGWMAPPNVGRAGSARPQTGDVDQRTSEQSGARSSGSMIYLDSWHLHICWQKIGPCRTCSGISHWFPAGVLNARFESDQCA